MKDSVGFLLSDTARVMRVRFDERARAFGSTRAQWKALLGISRREGINQGSLAALLEIEPITLCRLIDRMEEAGMVERRRDPRDRRAWQLYLTEKAVPVLDQMRDVAEELTAQALAGVSPDQLAAMTDALERICENLSQDEEVEVAHG